MAMGTGVAQLRRFHKTEHFLCGTAESHDPAGFAYLFRRTICYARREQRLEDHLQLLRCYYNFVGPHRALKFGRAVRTPAMQAGLFRQRLTFRKIFSPAIIFWARGKFMLVFAPSTITVAASNKGMSLAA